MAASDLEDGSPARLDALARIVVDKAKKRLLWLIVGMYLIAFLDRVNVGFAALTMNKDLGFSPVQTLAGTHHDHLGSSIDGDGVDPGADQFLRVAILAGSCRSRPCARSCLLHDYLVSKRAPS
jgi:hypothetical protein